MDLPDIRDMVGRATRETFGERIRITPRIEGAMKAKPDPDRAVIEQVAARVEIDSGTESMTDERAGRHGLTAVLSAYTCSCLAGDLPWKPRAPDLVTLLDRSGQPTLAVRGCYPDTAGRLLLKLAS